MYLQWLLYGTDCYLNKSSAVIGDGADGLRTSQVVEPTVETFLIYQAKNIYETGKTCKLLLPSFGGEFPGSPFPPPPICNHGPPSIFPKSSSTAGGNIHRFNMVHVIYLVEF